MSKDLWLGSWDWNNLLEKNKNKKFDLTGVKNIKTCNSNHEIERYLNEKQIKTNYETQFLTDSMLNDNIGTKLE
jgi:hypothetical protein